MIGAMEYEFFQRAIVAGLLAALASGIIGTYVMARRIVSISGGLAHAAFGGIGLGYLLGFPPMAGALGFGLLSAIGIGVAELRLRQGLDTLIAMVWAVGMALGIVFASLAPGATPDLLSYLFGNILFVPPAYLWYTGGLDVLLLVVVAFLYRPLQAVAFDEEFSWVAGVPVAALFLLILGLTALTVVVLIRVVGVILVIALLTIPAAIARHWAHGLVRMMVLATAIGAVCITSGLFSSYALSAGADVNVPTGPFIILLSAGLYGVSAFAHRFVGRRSRT
ncbi:MAG: metal ABC transporter permease [Candidatus Palauibacterales bacterium]|nr:metal ABC transporter permease [Candidatus Palauibacterales bacterium]